MKGLITIIRALFKGAVAWRSTLPKGFAIVFILYNFIVLWRSEGFWTAIRYLAKVLFASEYIINQNVTLAIQNSPEYTLFAFLAIVNSVIVLYFVIRIFKWLIHFFIGQDFMAYVIAIIIYIFIEYAAACGFEGGFSTFIPFVDGLLYMILNYKAVLLNVDWFGWGDPTKGVFESIMNNSMNATNVTNSTTS